MTLTNHPKLAPLKIDRFLDNLNPVYVPHLTNYTRVQILFGGSSSGKSVFLAQRAVLDVLKGNRNYLICRAVAKTLRGSVVQEVRKVISDWDLSGQFTINKTDGTVTGNNGYQIVFAGLDDVEKLKSITPAKGSFTDIWIEEATEVNKNSVKQLLKRQRGGDPNTPKRLTLSFNPVLRSNWIFKEYFSAIGWADGQTEYKGERLSILKTTYKDNRYLTDEDRYDLENEDDKYHYEVYTLGNWGILGNVIFTNWRVEDLSGMIDQFTNRRNGLDFGFSNDPAAAPVTHYDRKRKTIYIFKELYERGLTNQQLGKEVKELIGNDHIVGDSSEPKSITELSAMGVRITPAEKGKDSVNFGIQWLQGQTIVIDKSCVNSINEFQSYKWREDKDGNVIRQPVDKDNHIIDALRYAYESESLAGGALPDIQTEQTSKWNEADSDGTGRTKSRWK